MKEVIVYTQDFCKYCEVLKAWLNSEEIPFAIRNISLNSEWKEEVMDLGAMGMPFTVIGLETFQGFNDDVQEGILKALAE